ncbi:MAG: HAD family hydrolase [Candidatus Syntropharchaeia archaeon]
MIEAILFDIYGTIILVPMERVRAHISNLCHFLRERGYEVDAKEITKNAARRWMEYSEGKFRDRYEFYYIVLKDTLSERTIDEKFARDFVELGTEICGVEPYPGAEETLGRLKEMGIKVGAVSNSPRYYAVRDLRHLGLYKYFDVLSISSDFGITKPNPEIFLKAAEELDVKPSHILVVGDDPEEDVDGAKEAGMYAALFLSKKDGVWSTKRVLRGENTTSQNKPDYIIREMREVLDIVKERRV